MENHILDIDREAQAHDYENAQPYPSFYLTVAMQSFEPNTRTTIETLIEAVKSGEINALDVYAPFKKLEAIFSEAKKSIEAYAQDEADLYTEKTFTHAGVSFTKKEGSKRLQFGEDHVIQELQDKIKARQDLLKAALSTKDCIFDSEGNEVPKVSCKYDKSSLTVKFK
jgi:hypothetical protein